MPTAKNNATAARAIITNLQKYGGECSGLVIWARMFLRNNPESKNVAYLQQSGVRKEPQQERVRLGR